MPPADAKVAVIGAGWAGCAAALLLARQGRQVVVFEASRSAGGRARAVQGHGPGHESQTLDNGQHILIGAYTQTLALMASVGIDLHTSMLAMPLTLRFPDGGGLQLPCGPRWPVPLDALWGIVRARGWSLTDKASLLRAALGWRMRGFACAPATSVAQVCQGVAPRVMAQLLEPLCLSALNTPLAQASGQVFLRVLQDSLFAPPTPLGPGSVLLLPRQDLSALFPLAALREVQQRGTQVRWGHRAMRLERQPQAYAPWQVDGEDFGCVVLACPAPEAARLVASAVHSGLAAQDNACATTWVSQARALHYEAIATVYAQAPAAARLPHAMLALRSSASEPAQFVFDRGQLGGPPGLLAFVVSACQGEREALQAQVLVQGRAQLGLAGLVPVQTVLEKRATFACTPGLVRPPMQLATGLLACGDYVEGPYPATLEGAVRSGCAAAQAAGQ